jgi:hypothetical protein
MSVKFKRSMKIQQKKSQALIQIRIRKEIRILKTRKKKDKMLNSLKMRIKKQNKKV